MRRRISPAALAALLLAAACGGDDSEPLEPPPEPPPDEGEAPVAGCRDSELASGALSRVCFPADWNGDLVVYAHGYVAAGEPLAVRDDVVGGRPLSTFVTDLGFAFATTSYRANGLVAPEAVLDLVELADTVRRRTRPDPARVFVVGVSEGGLVAALTAERHPDAVDGALAACGPVGDFAGQLDYIGDFRVVFDYFFPGVIPGDAVDVPDEVRAGWDATYAPAVAAALDAAPDRAAQLLAVTGAPGNPAVSAEVRTTALGLLWHNVFGAVDARERLGGRPYHNADRIYAGSSDDAALNAGVARYTADPAARARVAAEFETTGVLDVPVVLLHTSGDPIVPARQAAAYAAKVAAAGRASRLTYQEIDRYGHCTFTIAELQDAFTRLVGAAEPPSALSLLELPAR